MKVKEMLEILSELPADENVIVERWCGRMNSRYRQALKKGIAIAYSANGEAFMKAYKEMTADMTAEQKRKKHRKNQKITVKGIFKEAAV